MMRLRYLCILCGSAFLLGGLSQTLVSCSDEDPITQETPLPDEGEESETPDPAFVEMCQKMMGRVKDENLPSTPTGADANAQKWMGQITENGSFSDIDYSSTAYTPEWVPLQHVSRLKPMVQAYVTEGSSLYGNEDLYNAIVNGLTYWNAVRPASDNWYHNQISVPQDVCVLLILMRYGATALPEDLESDLLEWFVEDGGNPSEQTGANKSDVALHWFYRGCLQSDKETVDYAVFHTFRPLDQVNPGEEGVQYDYSYFQHGAQLYIGGYAPVMLSGVTRLATYTVGTDYRPTANQLRTLHSFVCDTYLPSIRGHVQFFNVVGRSVSRANALNCTTFTRTLEKLKQIDPEHAADYEQGIALLNGSADYTSQSGRLVYHYIGDYLAYQGPDYSVGLRLSSNRTSRCENGNLENLKGYFMSDGSLSLGVEGDEYYNIFPVWNWTRVPGVTCPQVSEIPLAAEWGVRGEADFCGGLSDGKTGLAGFRSIYKNDGLDMSARKGYFFLDGRIVCLGSDIQAAMSDPINTAVEQCLAEGDAVYSVGGAETMVASDVTDQPVDYIWHRNVGYFFLVEQKVNITKGSRSGSWFDINESQSKNAVSEDVCTIWINHENPTAEAPATYAYILVPGIGKSAMQTYNCNVDIISNTADVQAVSDSRDGTVEAIFYKKGEISLDGLLITVDNPCALMVKKSGETAFDVSVSNPARNLSTLTVTVEKNRKSQSYTFTSLNEERAYRGRTHTAQIVLD